MNAQHPLAANYQARYRAESAKPGYSHIRKRCACGKVITAKQMQRAGCCDKCVRAA